MSLLATAPVSHAPLQPRLITVNIAAIEVSNDPNSILVTYALGSCVAVLVHDPVRKVGGMIHFMLPLSSTSRERAAHTPAMFADTGVPLLFERMYALGSQKKDLVVKAVGGSKLLEDKTGFDIGHRNVTTLKKMFWQVGVLIAAQDVGGNQSRTARLHVGTGRASVASQGTEVEL